MWTISPVRDQQTWRLLMKVSGSAEVLPEIAEVCYAPPGINYLKGKSVTWGELPAAIGRRRLKNIR